MEYQRNRHLHELLPLLERLDQGAEPTAEELAELEAVETVYSFVDLGYLPKSIEKLKNLHKMEVRDALVTDITPLASLFNLQHLDLTGTLIDNITPLESLLNLQKLNLHGTQVTDISPLAGLLNLRELRLSDTRISDITPLKELLDLQELYLSGTMITTITPLARLHNLQILELSRTQVRDLSPLNDLHNIVHLYLRDLELQSIPKAIFDLNYPFVFDWNFVSQTFIHLRGTSLSTQPISLFQRDRSVIQAYYSAEHVDVREAKVIFLGDGGVGKTHTIKRILNLDEDNNIATQTTLGISINAYPAKGDRGEFRINFWDFGGQENMHAMHRCFLTDRTCYVVVISNRGGDLDAQARRWLNNIRGFAPKAPVILAVNKWEGISACPMDTNRLYRDYSNLQDITYYTAKGGYSTDFTAQLTRFIVHHAEKLDSNAMSLPKNWAAIRQELVDMAGSNKWYIDQDDYYSICDNHGLGGKDNAAIRNWLLDWFNDLGICFSHHEEQSEYNILNPRWLTSAIYILLNSADKIDSNGNVLHSMIHRILRAPCEEDLARKDNCDYVLVDVRYNKSECQHILDVMRKFGLSYQISSNEEFIPALCDSTMPNDLYPTEFQSRISYEFRYSFLPDSVVQRLMVYLCPRKFSALWCRGFRFEETNLTVVVDASGLDDTLRIDVFSQKSTGKDIVMALVAQIRNIQQNMGMTAEEFIVVQGPKEKIAVPADMVLSAWEQDIPLLYLYSKKNGLITKAVHEILGDTYSPEILTKAKHLAQQQKCTTLEAISTVVHNHYHDKVYNIKGDVIHGDNIEGDYYNHIIPANLIATLEKLIEQNCQDNQRIVDHLLEQLEKSESEDVRKIAKDAISDPQKKKNILSILLSTVGGVTSLLADSPEAMKTITTIANAVITAVNLYGPQFAEFISSHPPFVPPL